MVLKQQSEVMLPGAILRIVLGEHCIKQQNRSHYRYQQQSNQRWKLGIGTTIVLLFLN
jgi:hypothetical protein